MPWNPFKELKVEAGCPVIGNIPRIPWSKMKLHDAVFIAYEYKKERENIIKLKYKANAKYRPDKHWEHKDMERDGQRGIYIICQPKPEYVIEKADPELLARMRRKRIPIEKMQSGESIFIPLNGRRYKSLSNKVSKLRKKHPDVQLICQREKEGMRLWVYTRDPSSHESGEPAIKQKVLARMEQGQQICIENHRLKNKRRFVCRLQKIAHRLEQKFPDKLWSVRLRKEGVVICRLQ